MTLKALMFRNCASGGQLLTAAAVMFALAHGSPVVAAQSTPSVTVREERGVYTVTARFLVEQSASVVLAVLTDYEEIPRFMPGVQTSIVRERANGRTIVEQEVVSGVVMFSKRLHLILEIEEQSDALIFRDRCGVNFRQYEGAWRLSSQDGQTAIAYELTAEPSFDVPAFIFKRLFKGDSAQMIEHRQREIAARATSGAGLAPQSPK